MTADKRDVFSLLFCSYMSAYLPKSDKVNSAEYKVGTRIDKSPAELLRFVAEVAQATFNVRPLYPAKFSRKVVRQTADLIAKDLRVNNDEIEMEDRLVLFYACVVRIVASLKSSNSAHPLSAAQLKEVEQTLNDIRNQALGYKVCSTRKVEEFLDGLPL